MNQHADRVPLKNHHLSTVVHVVLTLMLTQPYRTDSGEQSKEIEMAGVTSIEERMIERDARKYQLLQAAAIIELFRMDFGRAPESIKELEDWAEYRAFTKPIDPLAVLTRDQIEETLRGEHA